MSTYKYFEEKPTELTEDARKLWDKVVPPLHGEVYFNDNEAVIMSHYTFYILMGGAENE